VNEERSFLRFQVVTLGLTFSAILVVVLGIAVLVAIPVVINGIGLGAESAQLIHGSGVFMLVLFAAASIFVLYRIGPARKHRRRQRLLPGVVTATLLWLAASAGLNFYIANLTNLGVTYGPIAAVIGIMLWFYLTAYAVLVGAELNAQLEGPLPGRG
jgi:membrane protein